MLSSGYLGKDIFTINVTIVSHIDQYNNIHITLNEPKELPLLLISEMCVYLSIYRHVFLPKSHTVLLYLLCCIHTACCLHPVNTCICRLSSLSPSSPPLCLLYIKHSHLLSPPLFLLHIKHSYLLSPPMTLFTTHSTLNVELMQSWNVNINYTRKKRAFTFKVRR